MSAKARAVERGFAQARAHQRRTGRRAGTDECGWQIDSRRAEAWLERQDFGSEPAVDESVPTTGGGRKPEPELDRLSNTLKAFTDQFGNVPWSDADCVLKLITEDDPSRVAADIACQNAEKHSDRQNARIEHDRALARVMTAVLKHDTELFKQFVDNGSFRRWLTDTVFALTYDELQAGP